VTTDQPTELTADEERAVAAFMARLGAARSGGPGLDARALWWKGQLLRRWDAERRVARPLDVIEPVEIAGGLIAAGLLLFWALPWLEAILPSIPGLR
jgi:hypothetical protein